MTELSGYTLTETLCEHLDLLTVLKASRAVSGEIVRDKLLETLLTVAIEHASATRGLLILPRGAEHAVEAEATTVHDQVAVVVRQTPVRPTDLPSSVLQYVLRTHQRVLLDDTSTPNLFPEDEYLSRAPRGSVLCLPLVKQTKLTGVLYLENNLTSYAFGPDRIVALELLALQAAISLENAKLYADLQLQNDERKRAETSLQQSEANYRNLVEQASDGIFLADQQGYYVDVNSRGCELLGYSREEILRLHIRDIVTENESARVGPEVSKLLAGAAVLSEWRIKRKDSTVFPGEVSARQLPDGRLQGILRDVSERKRTEEDLTAQLRLSALGNDVGLVLSRAGEIRPTLQQCVQAIVDHLQTAFARIWTLNARDQVLELEASAGMYTHLDGRHSRVPVGSLKIGLIAQEGKPHLTNSVVGDPRVNDQEWARREGMVAFAGHPLVVEGKVVGVVATFARHELSPAAVAALALVADRVAQWLERKRAEEELAKAHRQLTTMMESITDGFLTIDRDWRFTYLNPVLENMLGMRREELIGKNQWEVFPFTIGPENEYQYRRAMEMRETREFEYQHVVPGRENDPWFGRWYAFKVYPMEDGGISVYVRDVTEHKRAEGALRASEERFFKAFHASPTPMAIARLKDSIITATNDSFLSIMGYAREEMVGHTAVEIGMLAEEDRQRVRSMFRQQGRVRDMEIRLRTKAGESRVFLMSNEITEMVGEPYTLGSLVDITERKRAEEALRQSEHHYRALVEEAVDGIVLTDANTRIVFANARACEILGYTLDELLQMSTVRTYEPAPDSAEVFGQRLADVRMGKILRYERRARRKDGSLVPIEVSVRQLESGMIQAIYRDVSERKQAEEQLRASLREKEVLLKEVHHRVKNNLQVVSSLLSLQATLIEDPAVCALFTESQNRVRSMALVHENLYQSPDLARIDMARHIEQLCSLLYNSHAVDRGRVELRTQIADVALDLDRAIPCSLIVNELVSNALRHAFADGRTGWVSVALHVLPEKCHSLVVSDNGVGLPQDVDQTRSLGLQLVSDLTQQLGGTAAVNRTGGTTFMITW